MYKIFLSKEQAKKLIKGKSIHTFRTGTGLLLGADWSRESLLDAIENSSENALEIGGEQCKAMGHGLVIWTSQKDPLFVEVDKSELDKLEKKLSRV